MSKTSRLNLIHEAEEAKPPALLRQVIEYFASINVTYVEHDDGTTVQSVVHSNLANFDLQVQFKCFGAVQALSCVVSYPVRIPEAKRRAAAESIAAFSFRRILGIPEIDLSDGEVRIKNSLFSVERQLAVEELEVLVLSTVRTAEEFLQPLLNVGFGESEVANPARTQLIQVPAGQTIQ